MHELLELLRLGMGLCSALVILWVISLKHRVKIRVVHEDGTPVKSKPARADEPYDGAEFAGAEEVTGGHHDFSDFVDDDTFFDHL